jgi:hypothetical protein
MTGLAPNDGAVSHPASDGMLGDRPGISAPAIAETVRRAATLPLADGARLLTEVALRGGPWTSGAVAITDVSGALETCAGTGPLAELCDRLQWQTGEGPAHDVLRTDVEMPKDLTTERRWPRWSPAAIGAGARAVVAVRLHAGPTLGALTLYSDDRVPVRASGLRHIRTVAAHVSTLVLESRRRHHLERGLLAHSRIGQAMGMIMLRDGVTADEAFDRLRRVSQQHNMKIAELAAALVDTGTFPYPPAEPR